MPDSATSPRPWSGPSPPPPAARTSSWRPPRGRVTPWVPDSSTWAASSRPFKGEPRLGVCLDTCHLFAAGYDVRTREALDRTLEELDGAVGLDRIRLVHANDSRGGLGSQKDRHEHIGQGEIGLDGFRVLTHDACLRELPWILETPLISPGRDRENIDLLRLLAAE